MTDRPTHGGRWTRDLVTGAVTPATATRAEPVAPAAELDPSPTPAPIPPAVPTRPTRKKGN